MISGPQAQYAHAREKLFAAVYALVGSSDIRLRLTFAAQSLASLNAHSDLPPELGERFAAVRKELTMIVPDTVAGGSLTATTARGGQLAREILSLYMDLRGGGL
jgi:hypothetical protein